MEKKFKKRLSAFLIALCPLGIVSCETPFQPGEEDQTFQTLHLTASAGKEIVFSVSQAATKATETNASTLNTGGFKVSATRGDQENETKAWENISFTKKGDVFCGDKWWPSVNPDYHFYASNLDLTHTANGAIVNADTETDAVCAYIQTPGYNQSNVLNFEHILARIGTISLANPSNYDNTTVNSITLTPVTSGTYNIRTKEWTQTQSGNPVTLNNGNNDLWCIPGAYTMTVNYTLKKDDYTKTFTKTGNLTLTAGKKNQLQGNLPAGDEQELTFTITVVEWENQEQTISFP